MTEQQIMDALDSLRAEVTSRIHEASQVGDSAETQRLSGGYTSLDVLERVFGVD